jgi:ABC-2 type transport system permease protein
MRADAALNASPATAQRSRWVVARVVGRKVLRSGVGWGVVFGVYVATQALSYASSYRTEAARRLLVAQFGTNAGISALVGPAYGIGTVAGFTAWKCLTILTITGAVWGILTGTKLMRGEEESGRWELLLAGQTTRRGAAGQALAAYAAGLLALFATTGILVVALGRSSKVDVGASGAIFFSAAIVAGPAMFLAIAALTSQLSATRRQASGYASAVLGASYAIRMVADSDSSLGWLRWATPLGWIEELKPLTAPNPWALAPIALLMVVAGVLTVNLAGGRDLGASTLVDHSSAVAHLRLLGGPVGLALRVARPNLLGWAASITGYGLLLGNIAKAGGKAMTSSPSLRLAFRRLGVTGAEAYLGIALLIMSVVMSFVAAGQIGATRTEESTGRLEHLLVRPLSRVTWLAGRTALAFGVLFAGGLLAGLSTWIGAASSHTGVGFTSMLQSGFNVVFPSLVMLGVGTLVFGVWPRATTIVTYGLLAWSFLIEITAGIVNVDHWILDTSVFHQMAAAPSVPINWTSNVAMIAAGASGALLGTIAFNRRDLQGE